MTLYDNIKGEVDKIIAHYKERISDGFQWDDAWSLLQKATASFVYLVEAFSPISGLSGAEKKAAVLEAAGRAFDDLIAPLDIPYVPAILEKTIVDPGLRALWLKMLSGTIDALVAVLNRVGWGDSIGVPGPVIPAPTAPTAPTIPGTPVPDFEPY